jgi:hypothetical protein
MLSGMLGKVIFQEAVEAHKTVGRRGCHFSYPINSQIVKSLPALLLNRPPPQEGCLFSFPLQADLTPET